MKINTLAAIAAAGLSLAMAAAPAFAGTSLAKGKTLCEKATVAKYPDARSVRADKRDIRSTDAMLWFTMAVTSPEGETAKIQCTVDRTSGAATVYGP